MDCPRPLLLVLIGITCFIALSGCRSDQLTEAETREMEDIFRSGLEMGDDPFIRAETIRVLDLADDPRLVELIAPLTDDSEPVVRIAALRTMIRTDADTSRVRRRTVNTFNSAGEEERYRVLEAALEFGDVTLRRTLIERALRSDSARLRQRALQDGLLAAIDEAREAGEDERLRNDLLPELGTYVDDDEPQIAATALAALIEAGQYERADRFIERFLDDGAATEDRIAAARILIQARVEKAGEAYIEVLDGVGAYDADSLGIPQRRIDDGLLRMAILGRASLGDTDFAEAAIDYRADASTEEILEVLDALGPNPSQDAAITLGTAMRDANPRIRRRAIALYGQRPDARDSHLRGALSRREDFEAQKMLATILTTRFADEWQEFLQRRLQSEDLTTVEDTLRDMQSLLRTEEELQVILPLRPQLEELATANADGADEQQIQIRNLAAYMLFRISEEGTVHDVLQNNSDPQTRYAYLEHLVLHEPTKHLQTFRDHLYDDLFVLRLMAATGLAIAFQDQINWSFAPQPDVEQ